MVVGENIKRIRKEKGLTQKQLGELCKPPITESNIRKYENEKQNPKIETIKRIASALNVHLVDLMGIAYFDAVIDTKALADQVKGREIFEKYLNSLGFSVKEDVTEWHYENPDEPDPSEKVPVSDKVEYRLSKGGKSAVFTSEEYDDLEKSAKETIEGKFYKKIVQQSK